MQRSSSRAPCARPLAPGMRFRHPALPLAELLASSAGPDPSWAGRRLIGADRFELPRTRSQGLLGSGAGGCGVEGLTDCHQQSRACQHATGRRAISIQESRLGAYVAWAAGVNPTATSRTSPLANVWLGMLLVL